MLIRWPPQLYLVGLFIQIGDSEVDVSTRKFLKCEVGRGLRKGQGSLTNRFEIVGKVGDGMGQQSVLDR